MADFYMSNITGLLDVDALVQALTLYKQKQLKKIAQDKALLQAKATSLANLLSAIKDLQSFNDSIAVDEVFKGKKVTLSDTSALSATVTEEAPNFTMKVKVTALSQAEIRTTTSGVSDLSQNLSSATFTLRFYTSDTSYQETEINFSGGTLDDLVNTINEAQNNVIASVYFDGSNYKLMLAEKDVGASTKETSTGAVIEISAGALPSELGTADVLLQEAQNARLKIGSDTGSEITSPTNTFENIITGLTLTAQNTTTDFVSITISDSYDKASTTLSDLFNKINATLDLVNQLTDKGALFQGNSTITQIKTTLFTLTRPLQNLGLINLSEEGKYSLNTETFNNLVENGKIEDIKKALNDTKASLSSYLEGLTKTFQAYKNTQDKQIEALDKKAEELQLALVKEEEKIRLTFSKIEALMYQNEQLKARLENFVVSLSEANKK
ncbi:MAG: flagellar filament capping protein FliD [Caldimicrobium sp.]